MPLDREHHELEFRSSKSERIDALVGFTKSCLTKYCMDSDELPKDDLAKSYGSFLRAKTNERAKRIVIAEAIVEVCGWRLVYADNFGLKPKALIVPNHNIGGFSIMIGNNPPVDDDIAATHIGHELGHTLFYTAKEHGTPVRIMNSRTAELEEDFCDKFSEAMLPV